MKRRHQRRAFAAGGDIAAAEIADHIDVGQFRQQRTVDELYRKTVARTMTHRLAVTADCSYCNAGRLRQQRFHAARVFRRQRIGGARGTFQFIVAAGIQGEQLIAQRQWERVVAVRNQSRCAVGEIDQYAIDAVETGAGHQAGEHCAHGSQSSRARLVVRNRPSCSPSGCASAAKRGFCSVVIGGASGMATRSGFCCVSLTRNS